MSSMSSFVNGIIAGAGAVLVIMSVAFLQMTSPLEGVMGFTTTEIRVAILLGAIVCAVAVGYEFYSKKEKEQGKLDETKDLGIEKEKIEKTQKTAKIQDLESRLDKAEKEIQENTQSKDTVSKDE